MAHGDCNPADIAPLPPPAQPHLGKPDWDRTLGNGQLPCPAHFPAEIPISKV
jgi:hypothetical protein